jgi:uncharacterized protein (UPF0264 family)
MTGMLASVNSLDEALLVLKTSVNIIDLKNPQQGALGALSTEIIIEIVKAVNHKKPVSATIGDIPMQPELVFNAANAIAKTGVDYIKIGFFPDGDWGNCLSELTKLTQQGNHLIAVLFADTEPDFEIIIPIQEAGFTGVMLDTMDKSLGSLSQIMPQHKIKEFVTLSRKSQLLCGLAGSLKANDIPRLIPLEADYLGFRGALCDQQNRTAQLNLDAIPILLKQFE